MYNIRFIEKVINNGIVDTRKYRYVCKRNFVAQWIERIELKYLDTMAAYRYDAWEVIWKERF